MAVKVVDRSAIKTQKQFPRSNVNRRVSERMNPAAYAITAHT